MHLTPKIERYTAPAIFAQVIDILRKNPNTVIFVDEVDYAYRKPNLLGFLRDIADKTLATVILVGMEDAKKRLLQLNEYYFERCGYYAEFKPLDLDDIKLVLTQVSDVKYTPAAIEYMFLVCEGSLRRLVKLIYAAETIGKAYRVDTIDRPHLQKIKDEA